MRFLLDTHTVIWYVEDDAKIPAKAKKAMEDADSELFVSVVSLWELAIKVSLGKLKLPMPVRDIAEELRENKASFIPISEEHALATERLPWHHRDPFDRMLAAQARHEGLTLVSVDEIFDQYDVARIW